MCTGYSLTHEIVSSRKKLLKRVKESRKKFLPRTGFKLGFLWSKSWATDALDRSAFIHWHNCTMFVWIVKNKYLKYLKFQFGERMMVPTGALHPPLTTRAPAHEAKMQHSESLVSKLSISTSFFSGPFYKINN